MARLVPYDQGYRDGWHDIHVSHKLRRKKRRAGNEEYDLGYRHGREDGQTWGQYPEWQEFSKVRHPGDPQRLSWVLIDGTFHARVEAQSRSVPKKGVSVANRGVPA